MLRTAAPCLLLALAPAAAAQITHVFEMDPSVFQNVTWTATSNLGPLGAFLQSYSFSGDVVVGFDQSPGVGTARFTGARLVMPNSVVGAVQGGPSAVVAYRDVVLDLTSADFTLQPTGTGSVFSTAIELRVASGFVAVQPPLGPAIELPIAGTALGSIAVTGALIAAGMPLQVSLDPFEFELDFAVPGFMGTFTHAVNTFTGTTGCPTPAPYCPPDPADPSAGARLDAVGVTSVGANGLTLTVRNAPPSTFGLVFFGPAAAEVAGGQGTLCVAGPWVRLSVVATGAGAVDVPVPLGPGSPYAPWLAPGSHHCFQFWHRTSGGAGFGWSNALAVTFCE